ncbi:unnamed protein product [Linum trigynum]|uniref:DUF2232 domain-containing protein n=1 Tax=Linum trigynum TaxID=586398 RepID=A0AAV2F315_9ROSI
MNFLRIHNRSYQPRILHVDQLPHLRHLSATVQLPSTQRLSLISSSTILPLSLRKPTFKFSSIPRINASVVDGKEEERQEERESEEGLCDDGTETDYLAPDGDVYRNTLRLVECSMFAAVTGLVYFLSNSLSIENYFGCFFSLPIVISSLRWGVAAGRKTMVATAMLLFVLSGPVKALTYLLTHGILGLTMGSLWSLQANWTVSIFVCTIARATGAMGYVFTSSFLIRENILALITVNIHASLSYVFAATGINTIPSMNFIYTLFGILVLINSGFFVFLLHLLYSVFLTRLGMRSLLRLPAWLDRAL